MNKFFTLAISALAATLACAADLTPQELKKLVNENNAKASMIKRTLEGIPNWHNDKIKRNPEFINSNVTELVKLVKLPVGPATIVTEAKVHELAARAYSQPLNLRLFDYAKKHYTEAIRLATNPAEKAEFSWIYAHYMLRAAKEGDAAQWNKAKVDAFATAGLEPLDKLRLLEYGIPGLTYEKDGWEIVKDKPGLQPKYYIGLLQSIRSAASARNGGANPLDPGLSNEHSLEISEKALAGTALAPRDKALIADFKVSALENLARFAEAENTLLTLAASTNAWERSEYSIRLGDFYVRRAKRYYSDPEPTILNKAFAAYAVAIAHAPDNFGFVMKQIDVLMQLKKYDEAITRTDYLASISRDKNALKIVNKYYAECHYFKGDYAKACEYYDKFDDNNQTLQHHFAEALYAVGRYDDAITHIKRSNNSWSLKEANAYFIRKIEAKKAAEAAKAEE